MFYALAAGNATMLFAFILKYPSLPPQIPLFYSRAGGEEQIADLWMIGLLPLILNCFFFLNIYMYRRFFVGQEVMRKLLIFINIFLTVTICLIFMKVIFMVS